MVGVWFSKKRAVALGIVMSGIAVGMYFSCLFRQSRPFFVRREKFGRPEKKT
jgi:hypothetical protein